MRAMGIYFGQVTKRKRKTLASDEHCYDLRDTQIMSLCLSFFFSLKFTIESSQYEKGLGVCSTQELLCNLSLCPCPTYLISIIHQNVKFWQAKMNMSSFFILSLYILL